MVFTSFRRDNINGHMASPHPCKWAEFQCLSLKGQTRFDFLSDDNTIISTEPAFDFQVPAGVMTAISSLCFVPTGDVEGVVIAEGCVKLENGDFHIHVANRDQFEVIVQCVAASVSYRCTAKLFHGFGKALDNM